SDDYKILIDKIAREKEPIFKPVVEPEELEVTRSDDELLTEKKELEKRLNETEEMGLKLFQANKKLEEANQGLFNEAVLIDRQRKQEIDRLNEQIKQNWGIIQNLSNLINGRNQIKIESQEDVELAISNSN